MNTLNRETILITGAAGFIGSTLSKSLSIKYNMLLIDDLSYGNIENLKSYDNEINLELDSKLIVADVSDVEEIYALLKDSKIDYVIHCAAIAPLSDCQNNPNRAMEVNVNGWINVLELSRILGVKKVLLASSNAVYENEDVPVSKVSNIPTLIYPLSKYFAESIAKSYIDTYDMNIVIMRFSNIYGPNMDINRIYPPFIAYIIKELLNDRVPTIYNTGLSKRSYLYSKDLCEIVELLIENVADGVYDVCGDDHLTPVEIYNNICNIMGTYVKPNIGKVEDYWSNYTSLINGNYPINIGLITKEINKETKCIKNISQEISWKPKYTIKSGLKETIDAYSRFLSN